MELIDGNAIAESLYGELEAEIRSLKGTPPGVAFIRVGEDPASVFYVGKKQRVAERLGIRSTLHVLSADAPEAELHATIDRLNADPETHGILVQSPLPGTMDEQAAFNRVAPEKDVDGFNRVNLGKLVQEDPDGFVACTPSGVLELITRSDTPIAGRHVVVVGRSLIVGKPAALLFVRKAEAGNATVTLCHSRTPDIGRFTREADILVAAVGRSEMIRGDMIKPGATVIDVGINRVEDPAAKKGYRITGDVHFAEASEVAGKLTPVPGGVGPMTVAILMRNTLKARNLQVAR